MLLGVCALPLPAQTLVNRWSFNGNLLDSSGNNNNGTLTGAGPYGYVPGVFGEQGLYFSKNNVISTTTAVGLPTAANASWSMNLWLYLTNQPSATKAYLAGWANVGGPTGTDRGLLAYLGANNLSIYSFGYSADLSTLVVYPLNQWVMLTVTHDGGSGTTIVYTNGSQIASAVITAYVSVSAYPDIQVNKLYDSGGYFNGIINEFTIWSGVLSPSQLATLYTNNTAFIPLAVSGGVAAQNVYAGGSAVFSAVVNQLTNGCYFQWQAIQNGATNNLTNGLTLSGSTIFGATSPTLTVSNVSSADAGYYTCLVTNGAPSAANSPAAPLTLLVSTNMLITQPGDPITDFVGAIGQGVPYPSGLGAADILDWSLAPYLNYGANPPGSAFAGPVGYVVTPGIGSSIITAARIYTSTNATADDPADFTLYGSNDGVIWSLIDYTTLALPYARNLSSGWINANNQVLQEIDFPNASSYAMYAVYFTNVVGGIAATNGLQFAEVQLLGVPAAPLPVATLVNRWSFNGNLLDSSGNSNNGTLTGAGPYGYVPGVFGEQGLYFSTEQRHQHHRGGGPADGGHRQLVHEFVALPDQPA